MIRRVVAEATIGFFLHIPFPSFEVFRMLHRPRKEKIIDGLLGADLVGFHTHEYVQHFLKTIRMVRGFDHQYRSINLPPPCQSRYVSVSFPRSQGGSQACWVTS